jgi:hypothetical protein
MKAVPFPERKGIFFVLPQQELLNKVAITIEADTISMQADTGLKKKVEGLMQADTGLMKKVEGLMQADTGLMKKVEGLIKKFTVLMQEAGATYALLLFFISNFEEWRKMLIEIIQ